MLEKIKTYFNLFQGLIYLIGLIVGGSIYVNKLQNKIDNQNVEILRLESTQKDLIDRIKEQDQRDIKQAELNGQFTLYIKLDSGNK